MQYEHEQYWQKNKEVHTNAARSFISEHFQEEIITAV